MIHPVRGSRKNPDLIYIFFDFFDLRTEKAAIFLIQKI